MQISQSSWHCQLVSIFFNDLNGIGLCKYIALLLLAILYIIFISCIISGFIIMMFIIPIITIGEQFGWYSILNKDTHSVGLIILAIVILSVLLKIFTFTLEKIYTKLRKYVKYKIINLAIHSGTGLIFTINQYFKKMCPKITLKD
jgi:hypothetical protein